MIDYYPSFFRSLLGLLLEPGATTEILFREDPPPYVIRMLLFFGITIIIPVFASGSHAGFSADELRRLFALLGVFLVAMALFVISEGIFLALVGSLISPLRVLAMVVYSLSPLAIAIWVFYFFSYMNSGEMSIADAILSRQYVAGDFFRRVLPYVVLITQLMMAVGFFFAMRAACDMGYMSTLVVFLVSIVPLVVSYSLAIYAADHYAPGTSDSLGALLKLPFEVDFLKGTGR